MSGTVRFDDDHIVTFIIDEENMLIYLIITLNGEVIETQTPIAEAQ